MAIISVDHVCKEYKVYKGVNEETNWLKSLFNRKYEVKQAVKDVSFSIEKGEIVGYVGPNGAGKSTTIKMLTGILQPTSGNIHINGLVPCISRKENAMNVGVVFGQRSQLYWDLPMMDTFDLHKKMYKIDEKRFRENVDFFVQALNMGEFVNRPVRQLSLGQRMRAEFSVALLHDPEIVYLDEPTIGLDVVSKKRIRSFIREVNQERKTTFLITTHDMGDIEEVCERLILIDHGSKQYDGNLNAFKQQYITNDRIEFTFLDYNTEICNADYDGIEISIIGDGKGQVVFEKLKYSSMDIMNILMKSFILLDVRSYEHKVEDILAQLYTLNGNEMCR